MKGFSMYFEGYRFTAAHEAGHAVCVACFPPPTAEEKAEAASQKLNRRVFQPPYNPSREDESESRIKEISFAYYKAEKMFDGTSQSDHLGLSEEEQLFTTLGGRVAELMTRTEESWDVAKIQTRFSSGEFDRTQDMIEANRLLSKINENSQKKRSLAEFVSIVFYFLKEHWDLVIQVAKELLNKYDPQTCKAIILYNQFLPETKANLQQLRNYRSKLTLL